MKDQALGFHHASFLPGRDAAAANISNGPICAAMAGSALGAGRQLIRNQDHVAFDARAKPRRASLDLGIQSLAKSEP